ncbi:MAG: glycoside hydrolase family 127 protein, partial [Sedimentisphaerales bacterium]|nr:glycoside hydrolase family 127 protein [Sedimentisphaerales bacterium]
MKRIRLLKCNIYTITMIAAFVALTGCQVQQKPGKLTAVPFTDVTISDEFWAPRMETNRKVTVPYDFEKCEQTRRIDNFAKAGGLMEGEFEGIFFNDSDLYKVVEGAAYSLKIHPDPELEKYVDGVIEKIAAAQWEDGYLYTFYSLPKHQPEKRWTDVKNKHELYCAGHFFEAAVAYYQTTGKRKILDVAIRLADYIDSVFGPGKKHDVPGHEEIEIGLVKLYGVTGEKRYLALAKFFLDERGRAHGREIYGDYCQDHKPVIEQEAAVGHAVRAGYLYTGMADVAALTSDADYIKALDRIWLDVVSKKLYITGGIGARGGGESFGADYELPNATAYCETCAAIANAMWNHRMSSLHGDAKYIDILERVIYNGFLSGISLSGNKFFYPNPLASEGKYERSPWFGCACCPTNIVRFMPSLPGYAYAQRADSIYVNLFIAGSAEIKIGQNTIHMQQQTHYPWDGNVKIAVEPEYLGHFTVCVRIPGWARNRPVPSDLYNYPDMCWEEVMLKVNGNPVALDIVKGYARIRRAWKKGDAIELNLPMPIRRVVAHPEVKDDTGRTAIERGPVVYCFEGADNPKGVANLVLPPEAKLQSEYRDDLLGGIVTISGRGQIRQDDKKIEDIDVVAIP